MERLRDLVILNAVPDAGTKGLIAAPPDRLARMSEQAASFGQAELSRAADLANTGLTEMRGATAPRLLLELVFARILLPGGEESARSLAARLERLERFGPPASATPSTGAPAEQPTQAPVTHAADAPAAAPTPAPAQAASALAPPPWRNAPAPPAQAAPAQQQPSQSAPAASAGGAGYDVSMIRGRWEEVLERVRAVSRVAWTMVSADNANVVGVEGRTIQLGFKIPTLRQNFPGSKYEDTLRQVLGQVFGGEWRVEVLVDPSAGHGGQAGGGQPGQRAAAPAQVPQQQSPAPQPTPSPVAQSPAPPTTAAPAPGPQPEPPAPPPFVASEPEPPPAYDEDPGPPPPFPEEPPSDEHFDPHLAALDDEAVPNDPGPSARDLLIKELGASFVDEIQNTD
jgi:DNA polymerase-3 subunit gamma/tau